MATLGLSHEAQEVVNKAIHIAKERQDEDLDSIHLFTALISVSKVGRDWLEQIGQEQAQIVHDELDSFFNERYHAKAEYPEPTETYLRIMKGAETKAQLVGRNLITSDHLFYAVFEHDQQLQDRLLWKVPAGDLPVTCESTSVLNQIGRDLTQLAKDGAINLVFGRDVEIQQLIEVLLRRGKNSAILIGPAGVGKTAIVEGLALKIAKGETPERLRNIRLIELSLASLVAGTTYRGEFEERLQSVIREIQARKNVFLVIDEFHALLGTGKVKGGGPDAVSILKPYLARGEITCIGITTNEDFTRDVESDTALVRRFHVISIAEPSLDATLHILQKIAPQYSQHHKVNIPNSSLHAVLRWSDRYLISRHFPDKSIDILGKACARAEIQALNEVSTELIADIISEMAGVPVGDFDDEFKKRLVTLEKDLSRSVIGQEKAIQAVTQAIRLSYTGLRDPNRPRGVFLFVGPSGVGKTELARTLARELFGSERKLIRLDMSEYMEPMSISRLIGSAPGYVGFEEPGQLTQALRDNPHSIVLFDEIEKACPEIFDLFLQLFDEGRLTDSHGRLADGRNAIFIMTSNLGIKTGKESSLGFTKQVAKPEIRMDLSILQNFFRLEFLNRIDHIIELRQLVIKDLEEICDLELQQLNARMDEQGLRLIYDRSLLTEIAKRAVQQRNGARGIKGVVESLVAAPVSNLILSRNRSKRLEIAVKVDGENIYPEWLS